MATVRSEFRIGLKDETRQGVASVGRALDGLKSKVATVGAAFTAIGAGVAVAGIAASARQVVELGDKLRDLSFATGQSVEQLSFLDFAAGQSGTSVDAIAKAAQRLSTNLVEIASGRGDAAARALNALKLSADDLSRVDLAQQIGTIGEALLKVENPSQRAALGAALFGKNFKELAPLILEGNEGITELVDTFLRLNGVITRQDADKFDDLNDSLGNLQLASRSAGQAIAVSLAPALTSLFNSLATNIPKAGPALRGLGQAFDTFLSEQALKLSRFSQSFEEFKAGLFNSDRFAAQAEAAGRQSDAIEEKLRRRRNANRAGRAENSPSAQRAAILNPLFNEGEVGTGDDPEEAARKAERASAAAKRVADALQRESDSVRDYLQDYARDREAMFASEVEQSKQRARALIAEFATPQEKAIEKLNEIAKLVGENTDTYGRAAIDAFNELNPEIDKTDEKAKKLEATFADLGATFNSAFEDAILSGEKFGTILEGLIKDLGRLVLKETVSDPLAGLFKGFAKSASGGIGDFLGGLFGNARGGLYKVAGGGGGEQPIAFTARAGEVVAVGTGMQSGGGDVQIFNIGAAPVRTEKKNVNGKRQIHQYFADTAAGATAAGLLSPLGLAPAMATR